MRSTTIQTLCDPGALAIKYGGTETAFLCVLPYFNRWPPTQTAGTIKLAKCASLTTGKRKTQEICTKHKAATVLQKDRLISLRQIGLPPVGGYAIQSVMSSETQDLPDARPTVTPG